MIWIAIGVGGAIGAIGRHAVNHLFNVRFGGSFPVGIFVINALGCFVIGLIAGLIASTRLHVGETSRAFIVVGVLGGFTTFSSYGLDTYTLIRGGHTGMAVVNAAGQVIVGLAAVWIGFAVGEWQ